MIKALGKLLRLAWTVVDWTLAVIIKIAARLLLFALGQVFGRRPRRFGSQPRTGMRSQDY